MLDPIVPDQILKISKCSCETGCKTDLLTDVLEEAYLAIYFMSVQIIVKTRPTERRTFCDKYSVVTNHFVFSMCRNR